LPSHHNMNIRLVQLDGKLPNLALMKLSHWHKSQGHKVHFTRRTTKDFFDEESDLVYASTIFKFTQEKTMRFQLHWKKAFIGGTGTLNPVTVEDIIGSEYENYDYSIYPDYQWSLGFTARGCRLKCKFCVVPEKEGKPKSVNSIYEIHRPNTPKNVVLMDNDFFGQPKEQWEKRIKELLDGDFKVSFNQGINIRLIDDVSANALASVKYYDDQFSQRRLYTAWDNLKDEKIFFNGVEKLEKAGIPPNHLMVYMLVGFDKSETMERVFHRFNKMIEKGIKPYPMVYNNENKELKRFQRWVIRRYYEFVPWEEFRSGYKFVEEDQMSISI